MGFITCNASPTISSSIKDLPRFIAIAPSTKVAAPQKLEPLGKWKMGRVGRVESMKRGWEKTHRMPSGIRTYEWLFLWCYLTKPSPNTFCLAHTTKQELGWGHLSGPVALRGPWHSTECINLRQASGLHADWHLLLVFTHTYIYIYLYVYDMHIYI